MELTKNNFEEYEPKIKLEIQNCDFVSFDFEMTGLFTSWNERPSPVDNTEQIYHKAKKGSEKFLVNQVGICIWKYNEGLNEFESIPYSAHIFPSETSTFLSDSSSLIFLRKNNFDFNKMIDEGISYNTTEQQKKLEEHLEKKQIFDNININGESEKKYNEIYFGN